MATACRAPVRRALSSSKARVGAPRVTTPESQLPCMRSVTSDSVGSVGRMIGRNPSVGLPGVTRSLPCRYADHGHTGSDRLCNACAPTDHTPGANSAAREHAGGKSNQYPFFHGYRPAHTDTGRDVRMVSDVAVVIDRRPGV